MHDSAGNLLNPALVPDQSDTLPTPVNCAAGQSGHVWFLAGTFNTTPNPAGGALAEANRSCAVPTGTMLFLPIYNCEWDNLGVSPPLTVPQLRQMCKDGIDSVTGLSASIDGQLVTSLTVPTGAPYTGPYRVVSPGTFSYYIPTDNIYQAFGYSFPAQTVTPVVADGVFLMLAPLSRGVHVLHWTADSPGFTQDITYQITVGSN
jgi:hypothetical protein